MNTDQTPFPEEHAGGQWHHSHLLVEQGWFASKTSGWVADNFPDASGGFEVNFRSLVPEGTNAVEAVIYQLTAKGFVWVREKGESDISETPQADDENSHLLLDAGSSLAVRTLWIGHDYSIELAVSDSAIDLYVAFVKAYML